MHPHTFLLSRRTILQYIPKRQSHSISRFLSSSSSSFKMSTQKPDGIVLGIKSGQVNEVSKEAIKSFTQNDISTQWSNARILDQEKPGQLRVFYPNSKEDPVIACISMQGSQIKPAPKTSPDTLPSEKTWLRNEHLEHTRLAAAKGVRSLRDLPSSNSSDRQTFAIDSFTSPHAAATGAGLALWRFNHFKTRGLNPGYGKEYDLQGGRNIDYIPLQSSKENEGADILDQGDEVKGNTIPLSWYTGHVYAEAQNWTRELAETPANHLTPTIFCETVAKKLNAFKNITVTAHDEEWAKNKKMGSFISVTQGTDEPAKMLEIHYKGGGDQARTIGLVGKGITFDTGGISLKPGAGMKRMRADMGGAATVVGTLYALSKLQIPVNVVAVMPLTENMPSGHATKPGDVHIAMNGLSIDIDNTDAEGRLVMADALTYVSREFKPAVLMDLATLTGAICTALGDTYSAIFSEDEKLWQALKEAGEAENDPFWRMPLNDNYLQYIDNGYADVINRGLPAGACTAAIFLKQFVEGLEDRSKGKPATVRYAHIDIAGPMDAVASTPYQDKGGMTGRPTRAMIEFARRFALWKED